jgi:hypothetical protein
MFFDYESRLRSSRTPAIVLIYQLFTVVHTSSARSPGRRRVNSHDHRTPTSDGRSRDERYVRSRRARVLGCRRQWRRDGPRWVLRTDSPACSVRTPRRIGRRRGTDPFSVDSRSTDGSVPDGFRGRARFSDSPSPSAMQRCRSYLLPRIRRGDPSDPPTADDRQWTGERRARDDGCGRGPAATCPAPLTLTDVSH